MNKYGFLEPKSIEPEEYILGGYTKLKGKVINPSGQYKDFLPAKDLQRQNGYESFNCTGYGTNTAIETLLAFHGEKQIKENSYIGEGFNFSERFTGIMAGTLPPGNDPHKVAESVRKGGLINDDLLPYGEINNTGDYYSPNPIDKDLISKGKDFLKRYKIRHQWVFTGKGGRRDHLMEALTKGIVCVSADAWRERNGKYYKEKGARDNHYTTVYGYVYNEKWLIFDSYDNTHKELEWSYDFLYAKMFTVEKKTTTKKPCWFCDIIKELWKFISSPLT